MSDIDKEYADFEHHVSGFRTQYYADFKEAPFISWLNLDDDSFREEVRRRREIHLQRRSQTT